MPHERNPFENPAWLRAMLWLLISQQGGSVKVSVSPAIDLAFMDPNTDIGQLAFQYSEDGATITFMTKAALVAVMEAPPASQLN